jgi:hypothetical protein
VAFLWIAGWVVSHAYEGLLPVFGPTGWLPVPLALGLVFIGFRLMYRPAPRPVSAPLLRAYRSSGDEAD